jgi:hypothetical protein
MGNLGHKTDPEFNPESLGTVMLIKFGDVPSNLFAESRHINTQCCRQGAPKSVPDRAAVVALEP